MRDLIVNIGGEDYTLRATFAAAEEVEQRIGDPIAFAREQHFANAIPGYQPKMALGVKNIPVVLWIGAKAAGDKRTLDQWKAIVFDAGYLECMGPATEFLLEITTPQSKRAPDEIAGGGDGEGER